MFTQLLADPKTLALGAITGLIFGFLLQRGGVTRYNVIVGQFLFKDFTVLKTMLTAIVVGAIGVWGMRSLGMIDHLHIKGANLAMNAIGGLIFGVGMSLLGYCPGTGVAAIGQGSRDAIVGLVGMIVGAAVFAESYAFLASKLESIGNLGKVTLADVAHVSPWVVIIALAIVAAVVFTILEKRKPVATTAA
jgi:uncharacterized membrane protein YedE/YeeE